MYKVLIGLFGAAVLINPSMLSQEAIVQNKDILLSIGLALIAYPWLSAQFE
jgi:hypothetical protein